MVEAETTLWQSSRKGSVQGYEPRPVYPSPAGEEGGLFLRLERSMDVNRQQNWRQRLGERRYRSREGATSEYNNPLTQSGVAL